VKALRREKERKELSTKQDPNALARFFVVTIQGMRGMARLKSGRKALEQVAKSHWRYSTLQSQNQARGNGPEDTFGGRRPAGRRRGFEATAALLDEVSSGLLGNCDWPQLLPLNDATTEAQRAGWRRSARSFLTPWASLVSQILVALGKSAQHLLSSNDPSILCLFEDRKAAEI